MTARQENVRSATAASAAGVPEPGTGARVVWVVLPAYNEADNLAPLLIALEQAERGEVRLHPIVVDDGSSDGTAELVRSYHGPLSLTPIYHPRNLGLGAAIRSGLLKAVELAGPLDVVVTMDADDTHTPQAIARMVARIDHGKDVVIASRYTDGARVIGVPAGRRFLSYAASLVFRSVFPIPGVRDFTCGYRAYRASVLRDAVLRYRDEFINQEGFQCMVDILLKLSRMGLAFDEVPLVLRYDLKSGKSKMKVFRTARKTIGLLIRRRLGS